ncbi:DNA adenine methylase [soil metagenome]
MQKTISPLRYPGGKIRFLNFFNDILNLNQLQEATYIEPFAGGASLALALLHTGSVSKIYLNDIDYAIYAFWKSILTECNRFVDLVYRTPINISEWQRQWMIYNGNRKDRFLLGFATFFLNRTNYSGILNGRMIGGYHQSGTWRLDARFNRDSLALRILTLQQLRSRIVLSCEDAQSFLLKRRFGSKSLTYLDPPYFNQARRLYLNYYEADDHQRISLRAKAMKTPWIISYDNVPEIKAHYTGIRRRRLKLLHTAGKVKIGTEVMFFSPNIEIPTHMGGMNGRT